MTHHWSWGIYQWVVKIFIVVSEQLRGDEAQLRGSIDRFVIVAGNSSRALDQGQDDGPTFSNSRCSDGGRQ